jgi:TatD DNase family protein
MRFDTHFHLDLAKDPEAVAKLINLEKIYTLAVTNLPQLFEHTERLCKGSGYLRPALGFHPELIFKYEHQINLFASLIKRTKYIGEIGLDNYNKTAEDYLKQKKVFTEIINLCAAEKNKILTIHSRWAEKDVIDIIGGNFPGKVILHWYSGSLKNLEAALSNGYFFSINLPMTRTENGKKIISAIPDDRLLLETDGPFTTYNDRPCMPTDTSIILEEFKKLRTNDKPKWAYDLSANFRNLLATDTA